VLIRNDIRCAAQIACGGSRQRERVDGTRAGWIAAPISGFALSSACSHASATRHTLGLIKASATYTASDAA